ncbi:MAG: serine hydrolase [Caulobacteraceae bacterium]
MRENDGTAIDVLMKQVGGPGAVSAFLEQKGVTGLRVDRYAREIGVELLGMPSFRPDWKDPAAFSAARDQVTARERQSAMNQFILDPRDSSTVPAALGFLGLLAGGQLISPPSLARLLGWMQDAPARPLRRRPAARRHRRAGDRRDHGGPRIHRGDGGIGDRHLPGRPALRARRLPGRIDRDVEGAQRALFRCRAAGGRRYRLILGLTLGKAVH